MLHPIETGPRVPRVPFVIREPTAWRELTITAGIGLAGLITGACLVLLHLGRF
jgi:hypothetical protein